MWDRCGPPAPGDRQREPEVRRCHAKARYLFDRRGKLVPFVTRRDLGPRSHRRKGFSSSPALLSRQQRRQWRQQGMLRRRISQLSRPKIERSSRAAALAARGAEPRRGRVPPALYANQMLNQAERQRLKLGLYSLLAGQDLCLASPFFCPARWQSSGGVGESGSPSLELT